MLMKDGWKIPVPVETIAFRERFYHAYERQFNFIRTVKKVKRASTLTSSMFENSEN